MQYGRSSRIKIRRIREHMDIGMEKLVSVIVLSYKNTDGIFDTLGSIFEQDMHNIEVVISDDGTPGFETVIPRLRNFIDEKKGKNITNVVINSIKVNGGTVKNINDAISKSNGEYIKVLSAEDVFSCSDALSRYVSFMEKHDFKIAFAKMRGVTPEGTYRYELQSCESDYKCLKKYSPEDTAKRLFKRNFLPAPAWIARRELFEENGLFSEDTRLIEDYPYWIYLSMRGVRFGYIDKVLIDYRLSGVSGGGGYGEMFMKDMLIIYDKYIFPNDKRFGILQPAYNALKRAGLNFYMTRAVWSRLGTGRKVLAVVKYFPFYIFVKLQNVLTELKNRKTGINV